MPRASAPRYSSYWRPIPEYRQGGSAVRTRYLLHELHQFNKTSAIIIIIRSSSSSIFTTTAASSSTLALSQRYRRLLLIVPTTIFLSRETFLAWVSAQPRPLFKRLTGQLLPSSSFVSRHHCHSPAAEFSLPLFVRQKLIRIPKCSFSPIPTLVFPQPTRSWKKFRRGKQPTNLWLPPPTLPIHTSLP